MTRKPNGFLTVVQVLESMPKARAHWRELAGEDAAVIEPWLRPTNTIAEYFPCDPACATKPGREIREWKDPIDAVCRDRHCPRVRLNRAAALAYQVDLAMIGAAIASALGAAPRPPVATPARRWWMIGALTRGAGAPLPVVLATSVMPRETERELGKMITHGLAPFVLAIPRAGALEATTLAALRRERCDVLVLEEALRVDDRGTLTAQAPPHRAEPNGNVLRRDGDYWTATYAGRSVLIAHTKGLDYISYLLQRPGVLVRAADLHAAVAGEEARATSSAGEIDDDEALEQYRESLAEIAEDLARARENGDESRIEQLTHDREWILARLRQSKGLGERKRREDDDVDRLRKQMSIAIRRALGGMKAHPQLRTHLDTAVQRGRAFGYLPSEPIAWAA